MLGKLDPGDGAVVDFVGAVRQAQRSDSRPALRQLEILRNARPAMGLDGVVDDPQRHVGGVDLDHRDLGGGGLVAGLVHHVGGLEAEEARHVDVDARRGDPLLPDAVLHQALAEGDPGLKALHHSLQSFLGDSDRPHAMVDPARPEPALGDLEAAAFAEQQLDAGMRTSFNSISMWPSGRRHSRHVKCRSTVIRRNPSHRI